MFNHSCMLKVGLDEILNFDAVVRLNSTADDYCIKGMHTKVVVDFLKYGKARGAVILLFEELSQIIHDVIVFAVNYNMLLGVYGGRFSFRSFFHIYIHQKFVAKLLHIPIFAPLVLFIF